jgi:hypothetical protein
VRARSCISVFVVLALAVAPGAAAKFRMSLSLKPAAPLADQPVEVTVTTDRALPPDHRLRLVAVAPGVEMYAALKALLRAPKSVSWHGLDVWLQRSGPREWRAALQFHGPGRWVLVVPNFGPVGYALPPPLVRAIRVRPGACRVTVPNGRRPSGETHSPFGHGNGALFTSLWPAGTILATPEHVRPDGAIEMKFGWWRGASARGRLRITGRRLDAPAPPLQASIPTGYGPTGWQATGLTFPTEGCWEVTGSAGRARLAFVTRVMKTNESG